MILTLTVIAAQAEKVKLTFILLSMSYFDGFVFQPFREMLQMDLEKIESRIDSGAMWWLDSDKTPLSCEKRGPPNYAYTISMPH